MFHSSSAGPQHGRDLGFLHVASGPQHGHSRYPPTPEDCHHSSRGGMAQGAKSFNPPPKTIKIKKISPLVP